MARTSRDSKGIVLPVVLILALLAAIYVAAVLNVSRTDLQQVRSQQEMTEAMYLAEAGLNVLAEKYWIGYRESNPAHRTQWLDTHLEDVDLFEYNGSIGDSRGTYTATVRRVYSTRVAGERVAIIESKGQVGSHERAVVRAVLYGLGRSRVFDYAYFANNFGWMWGAGITTNGDIRSNGNFNLKNPTINGDVYASVNNEIGADGHIEGDTRQKTLDWYRTHYGNRVRPTTLDGYKFGYDGESEWFEGEEILEMPYLKDTSYYEQLAQSRNSTLRVGGGGPTVNGVHNGNLVIYGTAANPIEINGPVVITGDVVLGGVIRGQGTIYSGRNVHIVDDITYETPPTWPKDGTPPETVAEANKNADFLGVASRGSIVLGDYTTSDWNSNVGKYIKPDFTAPYIDEDGTWFHGNYTAADGVKVDGTTRRYYESSFSNAFFRAQVRTQQIRTLNGLFYTNHLFAGRMTNATINGSVIMRDEAIIYNTSFDLNYDYRAREDGEEYIDIDLPKAARMAQIAWLYGTFEHNEGDLEAMFGE